MRLTRAGWVARRVCAVSRVLLIDNVDSFTFNVADLLHRVLGQAATVWRHDHQAGAVDLAQFEAIVVGPGPGRPQVRADMRLSDLALRQVEVPVLGICLGHQGLAHLTGHDVVAMQVPRHGIVSSVSHDGSGVFAGIPSPFDVVRYHSLQVCPAVDSPLTEVAWADDDGCVMGLADPAHRRWGVQFHPESVLSQHGERIVANFLRLAGLEVCGSVALIGPSPAGAAVAAGDGPRAPGAVAVGDVPRPHLARTAGARELRLATRRMPGPVDPWLLHEQLTARSDISVWLDASDGRGVSVVAVPDGPLARVLTHRVGHGTEDRGRDVTHQHSGLLLDTVDEVLDGLRLVDDVALPFDVRPGLLGYLGYELKAETGGTARHTSVHPDACLILADRLVVVEHSTGDVHALALSDDDIRAEQELWLEEVEALVTRLRGRRVDAAPRSMPGGAQQQDPLARQTREPVGALHTRAEYLDLVQRCRALIGAGESYEICLTTQLSWPEPVDPRRLHQALRQVSPVPNAAWLRLLGLDVVGASPERFVAVSAAGVVEARPIKGTRPRDPDPRSDAALARDLATQVKDRAENLMIVDLLRHDLSRVCRSGSVHVPSLFEVESYTHVHQLVSTVRGELAEGMRATDVLRSCFPGGSMTGAPKVRTMEIIDALEERPRGVYSGAIGWIGLNGAMDTSIVIRTAVVVDGQAQLGVGGAVTALSDPQAEYAETLAKARSLLAALSLAAQPAAGEHVP